MASCYHSDSEQGFLWEPEGPLLYCASCGKLAYRERSQVPAACSHEWERVVGPLQSRYQCLLCDALVVDPIELQYMRARLGAP